MIGGLLGGLLVGRLGSRVRASLLLGVGAIGFAIWDSPALVPGLALSAVLFVAVGLPGAACDTLIVTMLQTSTGDPYGGRVFGAFTATHSIRQLVGILDDRVGVLTMLNAQAGIYVLAGPLAFALLSRAWRPR